MALQSVGARSVTPDAVLAVDHGGADVRVRRSQEAVDLGPLGEDHAIIPCTVRLQLASQGAHQSSWIRRATSAAARSWPSCWAAIEA